MVLFPIGAPSRTVITIDDVPEPGAAIEEGLKLTVTSFGIPDADKAIAESKPLPGVVVIVELAEFPQFILNEVGDAPRVKSPAPPPPPVVVTVKETVVVCVTPPPVPVTVTV
jgi:hypothetical protein